MWLFGMAGFNQPGDVVDLTIVMQDTGVTATTNAQAATNAGRAWHMVSFGDGFDAAASGTVVLYTGNGGPKDGGTLNVADRGY